VFEIFEPFFFGAANQFKDTLGLIKNPPNVLILRMRHVLSIDATACTRLKVLLPNEKKMELSLFFPVFNASEKLSWLRMGWERN